MLASVSALAAPARAQTQTVVSVPATGEWVDTGINLQQGELLVVRVLPRSLATATPPARPSESGSYPATRSRGAVVTDLIGRIGKAAFKVGSGYQGEAAASGELFLRVNVRGTNYDNTVAAVRASIYYVAKASPQPSLVPLPNFVGIKFRAAAKSLARLGLASQRETLASDRPAGEIVRQRPEPGVDVRTIKIVSLSVSNGSLPSVGAEPPRMPNLVGRSSGDARRAVGSSRPIKPIFISGHSDFPAGQVYRQFPAPGVDLRTVSAIEIYVSTGPPPAAPTATPFQRPRPTPRPASTPAADSRSTSTPRENPTAAPTRTARPRPTAPSTPVPRPTPPASRPPTASPAAAVASARPNLTAANSRSSPGGRF